MKPSSVMADMTCSSGKELQEGNYVNGVVDSKNQFPWHMNWNGWNGPIPPAAKTPPPGFLPNDDLG